MDAEPHRHASLRDVEERGFGAGERAAAERDAEGPRPLVRARGGLDNSVTMNNLGLSWQEQSDALLKDEIIKNNEKITGGDPVASRNLMGIIDDLQGDDLTEAAKDAGLDLGKVKADAATKWAAAQAKERAAAEAKLKVDPDAQFRYQSLKELYSGQLERANKAIASRKEPQPFDRKAARAELDALVQQTGMA